MPTIAVNGPQPYKVRIGAGLNEDIAQRCAEIGASQAGIVFQPPLRAAAELGLTWRETPYPAQYTRGAWEHARG